MEYLGVRFLVVRGTGPFVRVKIEIAHVQFDLPSGDLMLLSLEFDELIIATHDGASAAATTPRGGTRRQRNTSLLGVRRNNSIQLSLRFRF